MKHMYYSSKWKKAIYITSFLAKGWSCIKSFKGNFHTNGCYDQQLTTHDEESGSI